MGLYPAVKTLSLGLMLFDGVSGYYILCFFIRLSTSKSLVVYKICIVYVFGINKITRVPNMGLYRLLTLGFITKKNN